MTGSHLTPRAAEVLIDYIRAARWAAQDARYHWRAGHLERAVLRDMDADGYMRDARAIYTGVRVPK